MSDCYNCKHLSKSVSRDGRETIWCEHPKNLQWKGLKTAVHMLHPFERNRKGDCNLYEKIWWKFWV